MIEDRIYQIPKTWDEYVNQQHDAISWYDAQHVKYTLQATEAGWHVTRSTYGNLETLVTTERTVPIREMGTVFNEYAHQLLLCDGRTEVRSGLQVAPGFRINMPMGLEQPWTAEWLTWLMLPELATVLYSFGFTLAGLAVLETTAGLDTLINCGSSKVIAISTQADTILYRYVFAYHPTVDTEVMILRVFRKCGSMWTMLSSRSTDYAEASEMINNIRLSGWVTPPTCVNKYMSLSQQALSALEQLQQFMSGTEDETHQF